MHGEAADFLAGVVGNRNLLAVPTFLSLNFVNPSQILGPITKAGVPRRATSSCFPVDPYCHPRLPTRRRDVTTPPTPALIRTNGIQARAAIDAEMIDSPMGVVDAFEGAGMDVFCQHHYGESARGAEQRAPREH
ncbi:hypothetical protein D3C78_865640 [compost metagenome]